MSKFTQTATLIVNAISNVVITNQFLDDHIESADVLISTHNGEQYNLPLYWIGSEGIGALEYWETSKAKSRLIALFEQFIEIEKDSVLDCINDPSLLDDDPSLPDNAVKQTRDINRFFTHFDIPLN